MSTRPRHLVVLTAMAVLLAAVLVLLASHPAMAQDGFGPSGGGSGGEELPTPHIIPRPNSGHKPIDSGDRGGSLQLLVLGIVVVALGGGVARVVRDSRRARAGQTP